MIIISEDKITYQRDYEKHVETVSEKNLLKYMCEYIKFEDDLTFGRFFDLLLKHKGIINTLFYTAMGGLKVEDFENDYREEEKKTIDDFYLELYWHCDYTEPDADSEGDDKSEFYLFPSFHGFGKLGDTEKNEEELGWTKDSYAIGVDFSPVGDLRERLLKIDTSVEISLFKKISTEKTDEEGVQYIDENYENKDLLKADIKYFTLFDVIRAILSEITFHGTPKDRNLRSDNLSDTVEEYEEQSEEEKMGGCIRMEEMQIEWLEEELQEYINAENYEKAERTKKRIIGLQKKLKEEDNEKN